MKPEELMKHLGGEILANKMRATVDGKVVILARSASGSDYTLTLEGEKLAKEANSAMPAAKPVEESSEVKKTASKVRKNTR